MTNTPDYEDDFVVVDKNIYDKTKWKNLFEDLKNLWIISDEDYENATPAQKKRFDELKDETRAMDLFE
jgi:hypothetical protein